VGSYDEQMESPEAAAIQHFYGKYRAVVVDVDDPMQGGRVRVQVPEVWGDADYPWAAPSWPAGSTEHEHRLPDVGAEVWVEFEAGDASRPIWDGLLH